MQRVKEIEQGHGYEFDEDTRRILCSSFRSLSPEEKTKYLDTRMALLKEDLQSEDELIEIFQLADKVHRYENQLVMITSRPKILAEFYDESYEYSNYNLQHKWDKDLEKLTYLTPTQWLDDLQNISAELEPYNKLKIMIIDKILQKYGITPPASAPKANRTNPESDPDFVNMPFDPSTMFPGSETSETSETPEEDLGSDEDSAEDREEGHECHGECQVEEVDQTEEMNQTEEIIEQSEVDKAKTNTATTTTTTTEVSDDGSDLSEMSSDEEAEQIDS
jgi:hypothetical protein